MKRQYVVLRNEQRDKALKKLQRLDENPLVSPPKSYSQRRQEINRLKPSDPYGPVGLPPSYQKELDDEY